MNPFRELISGVGKRYVVIERYRNVGTKFLPGKNISQLLFFSSEGHIPWYQ